MNTNANLKTDEVDLLEELSTNPELLFIALQQPISFNPVLVDITQSLTAGLFLSAALEDAHGEWVELDQEKIQRTTRLTKSELKGARQRLRDLDLLNERRIGFPSRTQFSINFDKLKSMLVSLSRQPSQAHVRANGPTSLH